MRATGNNQNMSRAQGINTRFNIVLGLMLSNGIVAFCSNGAPSFVAGVNSHCLAASKAAASHAGLPKLERIDEPLFPVDALREMFANAVGHRDYSMNTATLSFAVYGNRLEAWSPGLPPLWHAHNGPPRDGCPFPGKRHNRKRRAPPAS